MECSWSERVYYPACSPSTSVGQALELYLHLTVCRSVMLLVSASTQNTGQNSLYSDSEKNSLLPAGVESVA